MTDASPDFRKHSSEKLPNTKFATFAAQCDTPLVVLYHSSTKRKNYILLKSNKQNCYNLCGLKFIGQSFFRFAYYGSFDVQQCAQPRAVCTYNDNGRRYSSQDYTSIALMQWWDSNFTVPRAALCATCMGYMCIM